nr:MAG TPA: YfhH [Caudoviricetes sp.]
MYGGASVFKTRKEMQEEIAYLKEKLRKCNNFQGQNLHPCKDMYCICCEHVVMPDDRFPLVILGCDIGAKCINFSPNALYDELRNYSGNNAGEKAEKPVCP